MMDTRKQFFRTGMIVIATLAGVGAFAFFVIRPAWQLNVDQMNATQALLVDQDIAKNQRQQLHSIKNQVEHIRSISDTLTVAVSPDDPIRWVRDLEQLAKDTGNTISIGTDDELSTTTSSDDAKKPTPAATKKPNEKSAPATLQGEAVAAPGLGLRLTLDGDYHSLTLFLRRLELLPYYVDVFSVAFSKNDLSKPDAPNTPMTSVSPGFSTPRNPFQIASTVQSSTTTPDAASVSKDLRPLRAVFTVVLAVSK
jgi:hypothetical protein